MGFGFFNKSKVNGLTVIYVKFTNHYTCIVRIQLPISDNAKHLIIWLHLKTIPGYHAIFQQLDEANLNFHVHLYLTTDSERNRVFP